MDVMQLQYLRKNNMGLSIVSYCKIKNNTVCTNGKETYNCDSAIDFTSFLTTVYKEINLDYPKFFKMDNLSKSGILAAELTIRNSENFEKHAKENVAIILSNRSSSIDTDRNYIKTIIDKTQYFPSPSLFVYTLPNIVIGEIAIKHKITGENAFFVSEMFDFQLISSYVSIVLNNNNTSTIICGWVNVDENHNETFVFCVEKTNFNQERNGLNMPFNIDNINQIINKTK